MIDNNLNALNCICKEAGFVKKGKVYYRVYGDGVLQVIRYSKKEHPFYEEIVNIGLFSMYGEIDNIVFEPNHCCPIYNSLYLSKPCWEYEEPFIGASYIDLRNLSILEGVEVFHLDLKHIRNTVIPYMNGVSTQKKLIEAYAHLDNVCSHIEPERVENSFIWTDINKFAPFLHEGDYLSAEKVILAYLIGNYDYPSDTDFNKPLTDSRAEGLRQKLLIARSANKESIYSYMSHNYEYNTEKINIFLKRSNR